MEQKAVAGMEDIERSAPQRARLDLPGFFVSMWIGPVLAIGVLVLAAYRPALWPAAGPLLALWLLSPVAAWGLSLPLGVAPDRLSDVQRLFLDKLARRTWRFFEVFVTAEENWLAPDNFQEHPAQVIASRTSPTNIGIALLANLAAYDFGFAALGQFLGRTRQTLATLARLEKYRGHCYNWYETRTLKPLAPLYVSTVDSGNLMGDLLVLRSGLLELIDAKVSPAQILAGIAHDAERGPGLGSRRDAKSRNRARPDIARRSHTPDRARFGGTERATAHHAQSGDPVWRGCAASPPNGRLPPPMKSYAGGPAPSSGRAPITSPTWASLPTRTSLKSRILWHAKLPPAPMTAAPRCANCSADWIPRQVCATWRLYRKRLGLSSTRC